MFLNAPSHYEGLPAQHGHADGKVIQRGIRRRLARTICAVIHRELKSCVGNCLRFRIKSGRKSGSDTESSAAENADAPQGKQLVSPSQKKNDKATTVFRATLPTAKASSRASW